MLNTSIEIKDLKRSIDQEFEQATKKLNELVTLFSGKILEEKLRILNGRAIEDLVKIEIEENFVPETPESGHVSITNKKITLTHPDSSTVEKPISNPVSLYGQSIIKFKGGFLAAGGSSPAGQASDLLIFFHSDNIVENHLKECRKFPSIVETEDFLFIIGGMNSLGTALNTIEVYQKDFQFVRLIDMKNGRAYPSACLFNDLVYVASRETMYVEKFDPRNLEKGSASLKLNWPEYISFLSVYRENLIVFGKECFYIVGRNEKLLTKGEFNIDYQWSQSQCAAWENGIYYKEYFSGKIEKVKIFILA